MTVKDDDEKMFHFCGTMEELEDIRGRFLMEVFMRNVEKAAKRCKNRCFNGPDSDDSETEYERTPYYKICEKIDAFHSQKDYAGLYNWWQMELDSEDWEDSEILLTNLEFSIIDPNDLPYTCEIDHLQKTWESSKSILRKYNM